MEMRLGKVGCLFAPWVLVSHTATGPRYRGQKCQTVVRRRQMGCFCRALLLFSWPALGKVTASVTQHRRRKNILRCLRQQTILLKGWKIPETCWMWFGAVGHFLVQAADWDLSTTVAKHDQPGHCCLQHRPARKHAKTPKRDSKKNLLLWHRSTNKSDETSFDRQQLTKNFQVSSLRQQHVTPANIVFSDEDERRIILAQKIWTDQQPRNVGGFATLSQYLLLLSR